MPKKQKKAKKNNRHKPQDCWKLFKRFLIKRGVFEPNGRQPYFIGRVKTDINFEELHKKLENYGFERIKAEWRDMGQIFSARLKEGKWQYHLRIFKDGEVRGHFELRPKYILKHLTARSRQSTFAFFLVLLLEFLEIE